MAHGERCSIIAHRMGFDYWGRLKYYGAYSRHKKEKKISHRMNRAYEKSQLNRELINQGVL